MHNKGKKESSWNLWMKWKQSQIYDLLTVPAEEFYYEFQIKHLKKSIMYLCTTTDISDDGLHGGLREADSGDNLESTYKYCWVCYLGGGAAMGRIPFFIN